MRFFYTIFLIVVYLALNAQTTLQDSILRQTTSPVSSEIFFKFTLTDQIPLEKLTRMISIDDFDKGVCFAYANEQEFEEFKKLGIAFEILPHPGSLLKDPKMLTSIDDKGLLAWDYYPTYTAYIDMMYQFATNYPDLCQVFSIGTTVNGRQLLMAKISDNIAVREAEPQFLYTGTIHGNETTGYILLLRLIDYLLSNYGTNAKVTNLVNNIEIWINPLANPDGTYFGGNNTVNGARRYNANSIDLNRNYPDPQVGQHPDGNAWQPETLAFMQLAENNHFVMSANTHGGVEVLNYPWDTWQRLTADDTWWVNVCRQYVDTVHLYSPSNYMDYLNNGITNGYAWYQVFGGRQDYMNYFHHCREVTMELSDEFVLPTNLLQDRWNWNYRSLLNYIGQCLYGVHGIVTDSLTGLPLEAKVEIVGHDLDESFVYSDQELGNYHRLLAPGTYNLTFSVPGVPSKTIKNVQVVNNQTTILNVQLNTGEFHADFQASATTFNAGKEIDFTCFPLGNQVSWQWWFEGGIPSTSADRNPQNISYQNPGSFDVKLCVYNADGDSIEVIKQTYITVNPIYLMANEAFEVCSGTFYDSGGESSNYLNTENYTLTLKPSSPLAKIEVSFLSFDVQSNSGCTYDFLSVFDGSGISSPLIGKYCGTNSPGTVAATNAEGALTFQFHSNGSSTRPGWKGKISCRDEQDIVFDAGWSGLSSYIQPENPSLETMFGAILNKLIILQTNDGIYFPAENLNTIGDWNSEKGYLIKLQDSCQLNIDGYCGSSTEFAVSQGWNILPVKSDVAISVPVLAGLYGGNIILIKEIAGTGIYWPEMGVVNLVSLNPGKAYYLKASNGFVIDFELLK